MKVIETRLPVEIVLENTIEDSLKRCRRCNAPMEKRAHSCWICKNEKCLDYRREEYK